ncbi:glycosyltransferase family 2 protein [Gottschalkiaceae bacterium SANA]|nr:glycosyltransferase family 2 protein [Gottschalkiaceae bacterium SANA]
MRITVFTPSYNRADLLKRLYKSLCEQSCSDFEWLIVDDGSNDHTESLVKGFIMEAKVDISYVRKDNGGKHTAMNLAFKKARGSYFVCVDSDDFLLEDAIEKMIPLCDRLDTCDYCGFVGMCQDMNGKRIGRAPEGELLSNTIEIRDRYGIQGEPEVYKTALLRQQAFPVFAGEWFITEAILFDVVTSQMPLLYTDQIFMFKEFQAGGLTSNEPRIRVDNPLGTLSYYRQRYKMSPSVRAKIKALINYTRFSIHAPHASKQISLEGLARIYRLCVFLPAYWMYGRDVKKLKEL